VRKRIRSAIASALLALVLIGVPALASNDTRFGEQYGLQKIGAEAAWVSSTGTGITIAVVDSGTDLSHKDLASRIVAGYDFVDNDSDPRDEVAGRDPEDPGCPGNFGHGTHVSGIAAAIANNYFGIAGVAPDAKIMPVRALGKHGCGSFEAVNNGIRWAADHGAHIINLSLGGDVVIRNILGSGMEQAVQYAWTRGAIPVIAAGNDAIFPSGYGSTNAVIVAATNEDDANPGFSNGVGDAKWGIAAPGARILSTIPGNAFAKASGTSMATPHVAGAAAVLRCLGLSRDQAVQRLLSTADDVGLPGRDLTFGDGRLNLASAAAGKGSCMPAAAGSSGGAVEPATAGPGTPKPQTRGGSSAPQPGLSSSSPNSEQVSGAAPSPSASSSPAPKAVILVKRRGPGLPEAILALAVAAGLAVGFLRRRLG